MTDTGVDFLTRSQLEPLPPKNTRLSLVYERLNPHSHPLIKPRLLWPEPRVPSASPTIPTDRSEQILRRAQGLRIAYLQSELASPEFGRRACRRTFRVFPALTCSPPRVGKLEHPAERVAGSSVSASPRRKGCRPAGGVVRWRTSLGSVRLLKFRAVQRKRQRRLQLRRLEAAPALIRIRARPPHHRCMTSYAARSDRAVPRPDHPQVR